MNKYSVFAVLIICVTILCGVMAYYAATYPLDPGSACGRACGWKGVAKCESREDKVLAIECRQ